MPAHHFICRQCGDKQVIHSTITMPSPQHPYCTKCHRTYAKVFGFSATKVPIEIHSTGFGKFDSMRAYKAERDRRSEEDSERIGMEVKYDTFSPSDKDQSPVDNS